MSGLRGTSHLPNSGTAATQKGGVMPGIVIIGDDANRLKWSILGDGTMVMGTQQQTEGPRGTGDPIGGSAKRTRDGQSAQRKRQRRVKAATDLE
jgi:hypothetical protein